MFSIEFYYYYSGPNFGSCVYKDGNGVAWINTDTCTSVGTGNYYYEAIMPFERSIGMNVYITTQDYCYGISHTPKTYSFSTPFMQYDLSFSNTVSISASVSDFMTFTDSLNGC